ncbi:MAG TPA: hypothetical protein VF773_23150 [Verrucomicrobiae bacterium]
MRVLDINQNSCWSFHGPDGNTISRLRAAVGIADPQMREVVLQNIDGKAFGFVGIRQSWILRRDFLMR